MPEESKISASIRTPELTDLWGIALSNVHHVTGCGCCGSHPIILDGGDLENDILQYLMNMYERQGRNDLVGILESRRTAASIGFLTWLFGLSAYIDGAAMSRLYNDVAGVLRSFVDMPKQ
jgi:hypothetical protein